MRILLLFLVAAQITAAQATPVPVADAACARCHQQIYRSYLRTPMANASGLAADHLTPGTFDNKTSNVSYTIEKPGGKPTLTWRDLRQPGLSGTWDLTWFLGSGHLGTTWLYSVDRYLFESPVAWYASSHGYDMKPGLQNAKEMLPSLPMQSSCMRCHMSSVQPSDPGSMNRYSGLPFLHTGITCEACHGDTAQHVHSGGKSAVINPARLDAGARDAICISCHLEGDVTVEKAGHSVLNYRPGQGISDYLAYYVYTKADPMVRGVSEVEQLNQSMCKRMSGDRMSCTSCHDPHFKPAPAQQAAFYRTKCLACHSDSKFAVAHHPENPDCTSCHMPHNKAENIPHVAWTDHRILARPQPASVTPSVRTDVLMPIFTSGANSRDLGMAYYLAFLKGNRAVEPQAWSLLKSHENEIQDDQDALDALGTLSVERGDYRGGEADFRQVLRLDPHDLTALSNLGILLAKQGKLADSLVLLHEAFDRNRDVVGLAMNLARVKCMAGDVSGVRETLQSALILNPGVNEMHEFVQQASGCRTNSDSMRH